MPEPMSDARRQQIENEIRRAVVPNAGWVQIACDLLAEVDRLRAAAGVEPANEDRPAAARTAPGTGDAPAFSGGASPEIDRLRALPGDRGGNDAETTERCPTCGEPAQGTPRGFACSNAFHLPAAGDHEDPPAAAPECAEDDTFHVWKIGGDECICGAVATADFDRGATEEETP